MRSGSSVIRARMAAIALAAAAGMAGGCKFSAFHASFGSVSHGPKKKHVHHHCPHTGAAVSHSGVKAHTHVSDSRRFHGGRASHRHGGHSRSACDAGTGRRR